MDFKKISPVITFSRDGKALELGTGSEEDAILHLHGTTGLGLPPAEISLTQKIGWDGSHLGGVRYQPREIFIPIFIQKQTRAEATAARRELYDLLAPSKGPVKITVEDAASGSKRSISGLLKKGLEGDFGDGFHGHYQTLGLEFICPDPWWEGDSKMITHKIGPAVKPFISRREKFFPVILSKSTIQGEFAVNIEGDGPVYPAWQITGPGADLLITDGENEFRLNHSIKAGEIVTIDSKNHVITPDLWDAVPLSSRLFNLKPGLNHLKVSLVGSSPETTSVSLVYAEKYLEAI